MSDQPGPTFTFPVRVEPIWEFSGPGVYLLRVTETRISLEHIGTPPPEPRPDRLAWSRDAFKEPTP